MKKVFLYASLFCLGIVSCTKDYVVPEGELPSWLGESIYKELQEPKELQGTFNTYIRLIDDLGYAEVLGKTGSKTIFPANDEAFERFFAGDNKFGVKSYEQLSHSQKAELLFSSMIDNAILVGTLSNKQNAAGNMLQGQSVKHATNMNLTYAVTPFYAQNLPANNKYFDRFRTEGSKSLLAVFDNTVSPMVHFTGEYMLANFMTVSGDDSDFKILTGHEYDGKGTQADNAYIFDRKVIKGDVTCQNGYIHQLDEVLLNPGNMAEILRSGDDTHYISRMLDYYSFPQVDENLTKRYQEYSETATAEDSVYAIRYLSYGSHGEDKLNQAIKGIAVQDNMLLKLDPGWNYYAPTGTTDGDAELAAFLAPNDEAVKEYFLNESPYIFQNLGVPGLALTEANMDAHLDAVFNSDPSIFVSVLNNVMKERLTKTVPSTFSTVQNDAFEFLGLTKEDIAEKNGTYDVTIANNGVIYKMKKLFAPQLYNSVLGPASVYKDMRIMGEMLNDHQVKAGDGSKLGADMYYYLLSMKARYGVLIPTDSETEFIVFDPTTANDDDPKGVCFRFDPTATGAFHIMAKQYYYDKEKKGPYNKMSSYVDDPNSVWENIESGNYNAQIKDLLDYCTIVLADSTETGQGNPQYGFYGNKFYKTKHGGAIKVDGNKVAGGLQIDDPSQWSTITQTFDANSADAKIENGTVYRLDIPIQPTVRSVKKTLESSTEFYKEEDAYEIENIDAAPDYDHFQNFCMQFSAYEDLYTFVGILSDGDTEAVKKAKLKAYVAYESDMWSMFGAYNYTIYAPTYNAMVYAQTHGLPTWKEVFNIWQNYASMGMSEEEAKATLKEKLDKMAKFVRYHAQNNSLFADRYFKNFDPETGKTTPEPTYSTFSVSNIGIAQSLSVAGGNDKLIVTDEYAANGSGSPVTINASSPTANMLARDIKMTVISNKPYMESRFVVVHGIDRPLCYNANGQY